MAGLYGFLDPVEGMFVKGWAIGDDPTEQCAQVDVLIDGTYIGRSRANCYRADLEAKGIQDGFAAFLFEIPNVFRDGEPHVIDARHAGTDVSLGDSPVSFQILCKSHAVLREKRQWSARNLVFQAPGATRLADSIQRTRKLAIMSTYHESPQHLRYHRVIFRSLSEAGFTVLVVHASNSHRPTLADLDIANCFTILKRNIGYDFGSYAVGIFTACDSLPLLDELVFINDSVLQVGDPLGALVKRFRDVGADAVSCTDSFERHYHLQSYMVWFGQKICRSGVLPRFMADYSFTSVKEDVIDQGEIGLSRRLQSEGFTIAALFGYQAVASAWVRRYAETQRQVQDLPGLPADWRGSSFKKSLLERLDLLMNLVLNGTPLNPSHFFWDTLIEDFDFPFIKRELAIINPCNVPTYYKLGTYFPANSDASASLMEIRHLYGGLLIPPSIPHRQLTHSKTPRSRVQSRAPAARKSVPDGGMRNLRAVQEARQDETRRTPHLSKAASVDLPSADLQPLLAAMRNGGSRDPNK